MTSNPIFTGTLCALLAAAAGDASGSIDATTSATTEPDLARSAAALRLRALDYGFDQIESDIVNVSAPRCDSATDPGLMSFMLTVDQPMLVMSPASGPQPSAAERIAAARVWTALASVRARPPSISGTMLALAATRVLRDPEARCRA